MIINSEYNIDFNKQETLIQLNIVQADEWIHCFALKKV